MSVTRADQREPAFRSPRRPLVAAPVSPLGRLVSRIREEWRSGQVSDSDAVANALARTGRIITSAAAIMICVFAAFVLGDLRVLRVIGLGMAVAVLLDATLVRMVATPAVLQLMGRANWWFPSRLDRSVPSFMAEVEPAGSLDDNSPA